MTAPAWSPEEFETLVQHPELREDALAELLLGRTVGALGVVRWGIHAYHKGQSTSILSQIMLRRLERGSFTCPVCRKGL